MAFSSFIRKLEGRSQPITSEKIFPYPGALATWGRRKVILLNSVGERHWRWIDENQEIFTENFPGTSLTEDLKERT